MKKYWLFGCFLSASLWGQPSETGLTIYNQDFAVVRQAIGLELERGVNQVRFSDTSGLLEPDSVILRDPNGQWNLLVLEQNYRNDPITQELLLSLYEGQTIDFLVRREQEEERVRGTIIRSGYVPVRPGPRNPYNPNLNIRQPVIEVDGQLRFSLPGQPLFPDLADETILKPTLDWTIQSDRSGRLVAELGYVTGGLRWEADYNLLAPEDGDQVEMVGWVTMENFSGKTFPEASIQLMAGDVQKLQQLAGVAYDRLEYAARQAATGPAVTEQTFDEYHLYTLNRSTTLRDRETKQVQFVRAPNVTAETIYVYDGAKIDANRYRGWAPQNIRQEREYGTQSNPKIWVMREFENSQENNLGIPLPKGRLRFYRKDTRQQLQFIGEDEIDHTPKDETIRVFTGNAFDLTGERVRTDYRIDTARNWLEEAFEIKLRNHKEESVEIRVVEHLYRWVNWEIRDSSQAYQKTDSQGIEFRVRVEPDEEVTVTYRAYYTW